MPLDAQPLVLGPRDTAEVAALYARLEPAARAAYAAYFYEHTRPSWQIQMAFLVTGTGSADPLLPAYEQAYVLDWYYQLLPGAQTEYDDYILTRTPAEYQADMFAKVDAVQPAAPGVTPPQLNSADKGPGVTVGGGGLVATFSTTLPATEIVRASYGVAPGQKKFWSTKYIPDADAAAYDMAVGVATIDLPVAYTASQTFGFGLTYSVAMSNGDSVLYEGPTWPDTGVVPGNNSRLDWALDMSLSPALIWVRVDGGNWNGTMNGNPAARTGGVALPYIAPGILYPSASGYTGAGVQFQFAGPFQYPMPSGFSVIDSTPAAWASQTELQRWVAACTAAGVTPAAQRQTDVGTLITALKAASVWNDLEGLWLFAGATETEACLDIVSQRRAVPIAAPVFTANRGYKGNGTTQYVDTKAMPQQLPKVAQTNFGMGVWVESAETALGRFTIGQDTGAASWISTKFSANQHKFAIGSAIAAYTPPTTATSFTGWFHGHRTAAGTEALWKNGVLAHASTDAVYSGTPTAVPLWALAGPSNPPFTPSQLSDGRVAAVFVGKAINGSGKELAFYNALRDYMTAVGAYDADLEAWATSVGANV